MEVSAPIVRSARVRQIEGIFDVPEQKLAGRSWDVRLPLADRPWNLGLIVGPSGSGKSTVARHVWPVEFAAALHWRPDAALVDGFPGTMAAKEVAAALSSVGLSSPPTWLRPFQTLSNGEQFRATVARTLAESRGLAVIDEFTSVVDRTVAKVGSAAVAKAVRARGTKLVAVTCHFDVIEWLQPDWVFEPAAETFSWRALRRRPIVELRVRRVEPRAWEIFRHHHYLSGGLNRNATAFAAWAEGQPAAFVAAVPSMGHQRAWREHRTVCLPDFQGIGIGNAVSEYVGSLFAGAGYRYSSTTSHPAMIRHRAKSTEWRMNGAPAQRGRHVGLDKTGSQGRATASFEYVGRGRPVEAREAGLRCQRRV